MSLRTSGIYFIMITLAFTQMLYYLGISLAEFGGDDGMRLKRAEPVLRRSSTWATRWRSTTSRWLLMLLAVFSVYRLVNSRFGMVLRAAQVERGRASRAIGFSPYPLPPGRLRASPARCAASPARCYANHTNYITPGLMSWQQSGDLMFMVILGGMASTAGPVLGAFALLLLEEVLTGWTEHWQVVLGPLLVLSVLFFRRGLAGMLLASPMLERS